MRSLWLIHELRLDVEVIVHPFGRELQDPAYLAVHPLGRVPALRDGQLTLFESGAIAEYLCETYGRDSSLWRAPGTPERPEWLQWLHYAETVAVHLASLTQQTLVDHRSGTAVADRRQAGDAARCKGARRRRGPSRRAATICWPPAFRRWMSGSATASTSRGCSPTLRRFRGVAAYYARLSAAAGLPRFAAGPGCRRIASIRATAISSPHEQRPASPFFEMSPRDGLQNETRLIATDDKIRLVDLLSACGFAKIEVTSFVSPKWVPQLADAASVLAGIVRQPGIAYTALTPNLRGFEAALAAKADEVAIFGAASESFSQKNINCSIAESLDAASARSPRPRRQQAYRCAAMSPASPTAPMRAPSRPARWLHVTEALLAMGCYEVSLGDTIGHGTPETIAAMLAAVLEVAPAGRLAGHYHDTTNRALDNIAASLELGLADLRRRRRRARAAVPMRPAPRAMSTR